MLAPKFSRTAGLLLLAASALCLHCPASADSYTVYKVAQSSGFIDNIGWADEGSLVTRNVVTGKYSTFTPPSTATSSATIPSLLSDSGSACSPAAAGLSGVSSGICNGGRSVFAAYPSGASLPSFFLINLDATLQKLYGGPVSDILLDSMGDVAFVGLLGSDSDTNFLYYDTTSRAVVTAIQPEPSSLLLMETGAAGLVTMWWRRRRRA